VPGFVLTRWRNGIVRNGERQEKSIEYLDGTGRGKCLPRPYALVPTTSWRLITAVEDARLWVSASVAFLVCPAVHSASAQP